MTLSFKSSHPPYLGAEHSPGTIVIEEVQSHDGRRMSKTRSREEDLLLQEKSSYWPNRQQNLGRAMKPIALTSRKHAVLVPGRLLAVSNPCHRKQFRRVRTAEDLEAVDLLRAPKPLHPLPLSPRSSSLASSPHEPCSLPYLGPK